MKKNTISERFESIKTRAKHRNIPFWLSYHDFKELVSRRCFYCGFDDVTGLDRKNNNIGYVKENCVPCCKVCNDTKGSFFTSDEFMKIGAMIHEIKLRRLVKPDPMKPSSLFGIYNRNINLGGRKSRIANIQRQLALANEHLWKLDFQGFFAWCERIDGEYKKSTVYEALRELVLQE